MVINQRTARVLSSLVQTKVSELIALALNHQIDDPEIAEKAEEIAIELGFGRGGPLEEVETTLQILLKRLPYLSDDQKEALEEDIGWLLRQWVEIEESREEDAVNKEHTDDSGKDGDFIAKRAVSIAADVEDETRKFTLDAIPSDARTPTKEIAEVVKLVVDDVFGQLLNNLNQSAQISKKLELDRSIERRIEEII